MSYWVDIILAMVFGLAAAVAVWLFDMAVEFSDKLDPRTLDWWWVLLVPTIGGAIVAAASNLLRISASGGVVDVIAHIFTRRHVISKPKALVKPVLAAVSIITGNPVGSEAPVVLLGAQVASFSGNLFKLPRARRRMLIACGAAAGIASAFLSPLAAIAFSLEIILMEFTMFEFGMLAISTGSAYITAKFIFHTHEILEIPKSLPSIEWQQLGLFILLGVLCAVVAVYWSKILGALEHFAHSYPAALIWGPIAAGLFAGCVALVFPEIWGPGYKVMSELFVSVEMPFYIAIGLLLAKLFSTSFVLGLGGAGGDLAPGMFIGAAAGVAIGAFYPALLPVLVLAGICAQLAATMHAPLFGILLAIELSGQVVEILPVMVAIAIASLLALRIMPRSIYAEKAKKEGIMPSKIQFQDPMETAIGEVMTTHLITIQAIDDVGKAIKVMHKHNLSALPVMDKNKLHGILTLQDLRRRVAPGELEKLVGDVDTRNPVRCTPDTTLKDGWELLKGHQIGRLLIVSKSNDRKLLGIVTKKDLLEAATRRFSRCND